MTWTYSIVQIIHQNRRKALEIYIEITCHGFQQYFGCCFRTLVVFLRWLNENGINENVGFGCEYYWNINTISYHKYLCLKHLIHIKPHLRLFNDQEEEKTKQYWNNKWLFHPDSILSSEKKNVRILWRFMTKIICWEFSVDCHCTSIFFLLSNSKKKLQENYQSHFL